MYVRRGQYVAFALYLRPPRSKLDTLQHLYVYVQEQLGVVKVAEEVQHERQISAQRLFVAIRR